MTKNTLRIAFVCGSLEPRYDGVGDYVRLLAAEITQQGHKVILAAIHDPHINKEYSGIQRIGNIDLTVLRIPASLSIKRRFHHAEKWINDFAPDWISVQFVPYAFHSKGLPFLSPLYLKKLTNGRQVHIMFHELWVGMNAEATIKLICWGWVQRYLIKNLITDLRPKVIHTQSRYYQVQLDKLGCKAKYLPLFTNIPKCCRDNNNSHITRIGPKTIFFVHFGSIHPGATIELLAKEASFYARKNGISITLTIIGSCGNQQEHWTNTWKSAGLQVELLGEQPSDQVSKILSKASIGISTTPITLAEKSGAVVAMWEHGLPVLSISQQWTPRNTKNLERPPGITEYRYGNLEAFLDKEPNLPIANKVSAVSQQLINNLLVTV